MPSTSKERLERLAGDGKDRGGGLPLPPLFQTIAAELLDHGQRTVSDLAKPVEQAVMKPALVKLLYPRDSYEGLITDALEQMASRKLAARSDGHWELTPILREQLGKPVIVIKGLKGIRSRHTITLYSKTERERLSAVAIDEREMQGLYNDLWTDRVFEVQVEGERGGETVKKFRVHPLARDVPPIKRDEFMEMGQDIKARGVRNPLIIFKNSVLDGRHRLAWASALRIPVKTTPFVGTEADAKAEVKSQNAVRRQLNIAQRALLVNKWYLPEAEREAKEQQQRAGASFGRDKNSFGPVGPKLLAIRSTDLAAKRSNGLATGRTLRRMALVWNAPKTQERIHRGEIETATAALRAAQKELGIKKPMKDVPGVGSKSAYNLFGQALHRIENGTRVLTKGGGQHSVADFNTRFSAIRAAVDRAQAEAGRLVMEKPT